MLCETVKQYALALRLNVSVSLFLYTVSEERNEADTQRGGVLTLRYFSAASLWSPGAPSTLTVVMMNICLPEHHLISLCLHILYVCSLTYRTVCSLTSAKLQHQGGS